MNILILSGSNVEQLLIEMNGSKWTLNIGIELCFIHCSKNQMVEEFIY
jgi:hypothetical protein